VLAAGERRVSDAVARAEAVTAAGVRKILQPGLRRVTSG